MSDALHINIRDYETGEKVTALLFGMTSEQWFQIKSGDRVVLTAGDVQYTAPAVKR